MVNQTAKARGLMSKYNLDSEIQSQVCSIVKSISFKAKDSQIPETLEGKIVQDAGRLDAIGAIGIARAFAYGGKHNSSMHDASVKPKLNMTKGEYANSNTTTINHFYEKLLLLKDLMNAKTAKQIAISFHKFMESFFRRIF